MSKSRKQRRRKKRPSKEVVLLTPRQRTAEFITVGWMLTTLATAAAEVVAVISWIVLFWSHENWPVAIQKLPGLMLIIACLSGTIGLILCGVASRIRDIPAPRAVTLGSIFICLLPWMVLAVISLAG
ncbi:MAG TPA: hypothetical protein EYN70_13400 [Planctomycetaceae bacterium]|nr:hypothetical protein [Planctomycetaceae bacterium]